MSRELNVGPLNVAWWHNYDSFALQEMGWRDFTLLALDGELAHNTGRVELHIALFGLHLQVQWVFNRDTPFLESVRERRDQWRHAAEESSNGERLVLDASLRPRSPEDSTNG